MASSKVRARDPVTTFPSGHRYCVNVYTGCAHDCVYCYAAGYVSGSAAAKKDFHKLVDRDMADLERYDMPAAPVHVSNSTDPFQPLEQEHGHTRYVLEQIRAHRHRFTTVTVLTKDPLRAIKLGCLELFRQLATVPSGQPMAAGRGGAARPRFIIWVSLAFWRDQARVAYEPTAPTVLQRIEGIQALSEAGIPVVLRIDPLFPRSPIGT